MPNTELGVGSSAPDFKLPQNTGGEIALSDYRGKKLCYSSCVSTTEYNAVHTSPSWGA